MRLRPTIFSLFGFSIAAFALWSHADSPDPDYAAKNCLKDKRAIKTCCEEVLDGDKKEIAQCVKLVTEKRKTLAEKGKGSK